MELYYNTEKEKILLQIENNSKENNPRGHRKISFWEKIFSCCLQRDDTEPNAKKKVVLQTNQHEIEIKSTICTIFKNNKNSNVLMELSEFKKSKNKNNFNETNQERGIFLQIMEKMELIFQDALLNNYERNQLKI